MAKKLSFSGLYQNKLTFYLNKLVWNQNVGFSKSDFDWNQYVGFSRSDLISNRNCCFHVRLGLEPKGRSGNEAKVEVEVEDEL